MTAYKRKDRPNEGYRIEPVLPGYGRVGPWQTGFKTERQAKQVEAWVKEIALSRPDVIDALLRGDFTLRELWVAKLRGGVDEVMTNISDPSITAAVEAYKPLCRDERTKGGLDQIMAYAPNGARISWLQGKNLSLMYSQAVKDGRKPNSVRRSLHRAVSELLLHELKREGRRRALDGVIVPGEDDTRVVHADSSTVRLVLEHAQPASFRWFILAAIGTAVDRKPLLNLYPQHIKEAEGMVAIPDRKSEKRPRLLRVPEIAMLALREAARGKNSDEPLFAYTPWQVRYNWAATCKAAKVKGLRFKDLRHLLPTMLAEMGVDRREIQAYLGHATGSKQTDRYITPTGNVGVLNDAAARLGLVNLKVG